MNKQVLRTCDFQQKNEIKQATILRMCADGDFRSYFSLKRAVTIAGFSALICLFALIFAGRYTGTVKADSTIPAVIEVSPNSLNLNSNGRWITVDIKLPEGYNVADIDLWSVRLDGRLGIALKPNGSLQATVSGDTLKVKFDRPVLQMTTQWWVTGSLTTGSLTTGDQFAGVATIQV